MQHTVAITVHDMATYVAGVGSGRRSYSDAATCSEHIVKGWSHLIAATNGAGK